MKHEKPLKEITQIFLGQHRVCVEGGYRGIRGRGGAPPPPPAAGGGGGGGGGGVKGGGGGGGKK